MLQVVSVSTGKAGLPGYTVMNFGGSGVAAADLARSRVRAFWQALRDQLAGGLSVQVQNEVKEILEATGDLVALWSNAVPPVVVTGNASTTSIIPQAAQGLVKLPTSVIRNGHRLQGRFFIPGVNAAANEADGTPSAAFLTALNTAVALLNGGDVPSIGVWGRPVYDDEGTLITTGQFTGSIPIARDTWAMLRTRRSS